MEKVLVLGGTFSKSWCDITFGLIASLSIQHLNASAMSQQLIQRCTLPLPIISMKN